MAHRLQASYSFALVKQMLPCDDERNLQLLLDTDQMESAFFRNISPSAQDSWQFLRFEGKICSLRRAFTSSGSAFRVESTHDKWQEGSFF